MGIAIARDRHDSSQKDTLNLERNDEVIVIDNRSTFTHKFEFDFTKKTGCLIFR